MAKFKILKFPAKCPFPEKSSLVTKDLYKFFEKLLNCCYFVKGLLLKLLEKLSELIEFFEKINLINGHPLVVDWDPWRVL
jgi:hypothetical protein